MNSEPNNPERISVWKWFCNKWEEPGFHILLAGIAVVILLILAFYLLVAILDLVPNEAMVKVLGLMFVIILGFFIHLFTKPLPDSDDKQLFMDLKRKWMFLAYTFMVLALFTAVYPFTVDLKHDPSDPKHIRQVNQTMDSPIAVFRGCIDSPEAKALQCYPGDDEQEPPKLSWVLQVGGYVSQLPAKIPLAMQPKDIKNTLKEAQNRHREAADVLEKREQILIEKKKALALLQPETSGDGESAAKQVGKVKNEMNEAENAVSEAEQQRETASQKEQQTRRDLVKINLLWLGYDLSSSGYSVEGGLVIPFYLVVLSLIGGAISLTRRIPEYQKQAAPGYVGTPETPHLTPPMLREYLVFQIVQFISAPFIAAVAYYVLEPTTTSTTVGLAFAAGFASETVLLWVRAMVDKLKPEGRKAAEAGSLEGLLSGQSGKSATDIKKAYNISIVGHPDLKAVFSDGGQFVIDGMPQGTCVLEVIRLNPPDDALPSIYQPVMIEAGKSTSMVVDLA